MFYDTLLCKSALHENILVEVNFVSFLQTVHKGNLRTRNVHGKSFEFSKNTIHATLVTLLVH